MPYQPQEETLWQWGWVLLSAVLLSGCILSDVKQPTMSNWKYSLTHFTISLMASSAPLRLSNQGWASSPVMTDKTILLTWIFPVWDLCFLFSDFVNDGHFYRWEYRTNLIPYYFNTGHTTYLLNKERFRLLRDGWQHYVYTCGVRMRQSYVLTCLTAVAVFRFKAHICFRRTVNTIEPAVSFKCLKWNKKATYCKYLNWIKQLQCMNRKLTWYINDIVKLQ